MLKKLPHFKTTVNLLVNEQNPPPLSGFLDGARKVNNCLAKGVLNRSAIWPIGMSLGNYLIVCKYLNMTSDKNLRLAKFRGLTPYFLLKFGYSEKATKFEKILHLEFDATQQRQIFSGRFYQILWPSQIIRTLEYSTDFNIFFRNFRGSFRKWLSRFYP